MALRYLVILGTFTILVNAQNLSYATDSQQDYGENNVVLDGNIQSFGEVLKEMDASLKAADNTEACYVYDPQKPNFNVKGRRISEIQCLNYIWDIKEEDEDRRISEKCPDLSGIIGGRPSLPGEFPHMAALGWKDVKKGKWEFKCGGSLISDRFVLTVAHCILDANNNTPKIVRLGVGNIANETLIAEGIGRDVRIKNIIAHPKYNRMYKNFDIALLELDEKIQFTDFIQPACILNQTGVNQSVITGWGLTDPRKALSKSDELLKAEVEIFTTDDCKEKWKPRRSRKEWRRFFLDQICAVQKEGKADICAGDSGGPLQNKLYINANRSIHNLVGMTSFNYECGGPAGEKFPSVYTSVQYHIKWIEKQVWGAETRPTSAPAVQDQPDNIKPPASVAQQTSNNIEPLASEEQDQLNNIEPSASVAQQTSNDIEPLASEEQDQSNNIIPSASGAQETSNNIEPLASEEQDQLNNIKHIASGAQENPNNVESSTSAVQDQPNNIKHSTSGAQENSNNIESSASEVQENPFIDVANSTEFEPSIAEIQDQSINEVPVGNTLENNKNNLNTYKTRAIGGTNQGQDVVFGNLFWFNAAKKDG